MLRSLQRRQRQRQRTETAVLLALLLFLFGLYAAALLSGCAEPPHPSPVSKPADLLPELSRVMGMASATPGSFRNPSTQPCVWSKQVRYVVFNADICGHEEEWGQAFRGLLTEAPVVVVCHGQTDPLTRVWRGVPDLGPPLVWERELPKLAAQYSGQPIVLISCNESGLALNVAGVWYAERGRVWSAPNATQPSPGRVVDPSRFVEGRQR